MRSPVGHPRSRRIDPFHGFGRLFDVEWLRLHDLSYREVETLRNPYNGDRPVRFSRDGQELSNGVGRALCGIIDRHINDPQSFERERSRSRGRDGAAQHIPPATPAIALYPQPYGGAPSGPACLASEPGPAAGASGVATRRSSSGSDERHRKRRKKDKRTRHAPRPLTSSFEEHLEFFLELDYDAYVHWWKKRGASCPGPAPLSRRAPLAVTLPLGPPGVALSMGMPSALGFPPMPRHPGDHAHMPPAMLLPSTHGPPQGVPPMIGPSAMLR